ncbi:ABC transporter ATP-binding protein [Pseudonocardia aurantiaca]|uniref:ABC transporter ATP-binding protein n=1 Tax=Pseudonocardia aurantiaca TaxID=75290 RepID=A0ABW4FMJ8_9PSEU
MLTIDNLVKTFEADKKTRSQAKSAKANGEALEQTRVFAVDDVSFEVQQGEMFTLLGPSGCGKTTTLRSIAGLEKPDSGRISVGDRVMFHAGDGTSTVNMPANERGLGMVFQSYAIWPHMSVFDNVGFPLQVRKRSQRPGKAEIAERVNRVLEVMELGHLATRQATKLSGGQQQRLALARAIVTQPPLLLLDEPLSNLDAKLRESLRFELKRLQRELGITSIYVTHDQVEALALSSHIAVMRQGKVVQLGKPREIYTNPRSRFVAEFIGTSNFINGRVAGHDGDCVTVDTTEGRLRVRSAVALPVGSEAIVSIRPEAVEISLTGSGGTEPNEWTGEVVNRAFLGDSVDHVVKVGKAEVRNRSNPNVSIEPGTTVYLRMNPDQLSLVPVD